MWRSWPPSCECCGRSWWRWRVGVATASGRVSSVPRSGSRRRRAEPLPLIGTPRSPGRPTLGPRAAEVARRLGKPLMPHQRHIADVALEIDPSTGLLAYRRVILIGPRQATGKSWLVLTTLTHRCVGFDEH